MEQYTACSACGALNDISHYEHVALCARCSHVIARKPYRFELIVSLYAVMLIFTIATYSLPLVTFTLAGSTNTYTMFSAVIDFYRDGFALLSVIVFLLCVLFPLLQIVMMGLALLAVTKQSRYTFLPLLFRLLHTFKQWNMAEVFLISIFISMVKLHKDAELHASVGLYLFTLMIITYITLNMLFKPRDLWSYAKMRVARG